MEYGTNRVIEDHPGRSDSGQGNAAGSV